MVLVLSRYTYKDHKTLEVAAESPDEADAWKASLLRAGVFPEKNEESSSVSN